MPHQPEGNLKEFKKIENGIFNSKWRERVKAIFSFQEETAEVLT